MKKGRVEAFSDGVIAIIITIMVLEVKVPHGHDWDAVRPLFPVFASYVLSFVFVGIYWNNHHHLLHAAKHVDAKVMWANLYLLFWLSLIPFATGWLGDSRSASLPAAAYGVVMIMSAIAYTILQSIVLAQHPKDSRVVKAFGSDTKGKISLACYALAIGAAFVQPLVSDLLYVLVAIIWLVPDRRVERGVSHEEEG